MVDAGISDILLTYNLIGQTKLDRLVALARRSDIKVVADSKDVVEGLSSAMSRAGLERGSVVTEIRNRPSPAA